LDAIVRIAKYRKRFADVIQSAGVHLIGQNKEQSGLSCPELPLMLLNGCGGRI
jgi:hypothetical protein